MNRRQLLKLAAAAPAMPGLWAELLDWARAPGVAGAPGVAWAQGGAARPASRARPGDAAWPSAADWEGLGRQVGGRLQTGHAPLAACREASGGAACKDVLKALKNPYAIGDDPNFTQTMGWVGAWTSRPSAYVVAAERTEDVVAAVNFARERNLRLVVKGGGHSYQGTSNAPDSLLVWTHRMNAIALHDAFVAQGCSAAPQPAVSLGAGVLWQAAYGAVTTRGGRYVQGGGCSTVGVAGLIQSGGFGSFSKRYGLAAAGLLEAEVVTADGQVRVANACTHPDLFWGLKGGGGGSLGVVTRLTLRTRELPPLFGGAFGRIRAASDSAYRELVERMLRFYRDSLFNPHWGEQIAFERGNVLRLAMVFQGLDPRQAEEVWKPFREWLASKRELKAEMPLTLAAIPARRFWDGAFLRQAAPNLVVADDRPGAPAGNVYWAGDAAQAGQTLYGYQSAWLPAALLGEDLVSSLADALFAGSRHWHIALHLNKGLAGAPAEEIAAARDTATNPAVLDAFALAISGGTGPFSFPDVPGHEPDVAQAGRTTAAIGRAMDELRKAAPDPGSYVSESDYFLRNWQSAFWGAHYPRLLSIKRKYDPDGLFFVRHGVGSEGWSDDGFARTAGG